MIFCFTILTHKIKQLVILLVFILCCFNIVQAQTVFSLFKTNEKLADEYFSQKDYEQALGLYLPLMQHDHSLEMEFKIARAYFFLNRMKDVASQYQIISDKHNSFPTNDILFYAEALSTLGQYDKAVEWYNKYLKNAGDNPLVKKKIWRIKNRVYLYEDSIHFSVKRLSINTTFAEMSPAVVGDSLIFMSNRQGKSVIDQRDENNSSFFRLYSTAIKKDTISKEIINIYQKPSLFCKDLGIKFHEGPACFYNDTYMVFSATGEASKNMAKRTLQLYFAEFVNGNWKKTGSFSFNSKDYSITDPWISNDGKILYFCSDMKGGIGGKDIYKSLFTNGAWSKPVNLGDEINTTGDESFPYIQNNTLYFTSNGHAGLGGLDIFKSFFQNNIYQEVQNMGYPINTNGDDFAYVVNSDGATGYFTSNRQGSDDVFEVSIDLQIYPFVMEGLVKYKAESWIDTASLKILPHAKIFLFDNLKNTVVASTASDINGMFSFTIPYFSQYLIKVEGEHQAEDAFVSLDLSKRRKGGNKFEIVVVKNIFKASENRGEEDDK